MTTVVERGRLTLDQAGLKLADDLRAFVKKRKFFFNNEKVYRFEAEIIELDLLEWLKAQNHAIKIFWEDRNKEFAVAGLGASHSIIAEHGEKYEHVISRIQKLVHPHLSSLSYWGGFCFDPHVVPKNEWKSLGLGRFVLPMIEIRQTGEKFILACNILLNKDTQAIIELACKQLVQFNSQNMNPHHDLPQPLNINNMPESSTWRTQAAHVINAIQDREYDKLVLARAVNLEFSDPLNAFSVMKELRSTTSNCFCFIFQFNEKEVFLGASPERLYHRQGEIVTTEAVAGTRPPSEKNDLLNSKKDLKEQSYVVEMIAKSLKPLCKELRNEPKPALLNWSGGHHLITRFEGRLKKGIGDKEIISRLHPTPAVAGSPVKSSLKAIRDLETFDRGWYCGPVGYIGSTVSEFAVAIRSGLIHDKELNIYAGAGIIAESSPETEWIETENKLQGFLRIFSQHAK